jgi:hypothetical protein
MGGDQSKQTSSMSESIATSVANESLQNCFEYMSGDNLLVENGSGNYIADSSQRVTATVRQNCVSQNVNYSQIESDLSTKLDQNISATTTALTQWLDNSSTNNSSRIVSNVSTSLLNTSTQNCIQTTSVSNTISVSGRSNIINGALQDISDDIILNCALSNSDSSDAINSITDSTNQKSTYSSENPFAFLTDAIEALFKDAIVGVGVVFIALVCFIGLFLVLRGRRKHSAASRAAHVSQPSHSHGSRSPHSHESRSPHSHGSHSHESHESRSPHSHESHESRSPHSHESHASRSHESHSHESQSRAHASHAPM